MDSSNSIILIGKRANLKVKIVYRKLDVTGEDEDLPRMLLSLLKTLNCLERYGKDYLRLKIWWPQIAPGLMSPNGVPI